MKQSQRQGELKNMVYQAPMIGFNRDCGTDCCAVLLRGGKSRRMGQDKALLPWEGSTFLETIAAQLDPFEEKYLSVAADRVSTSMSTGPVRDFQAAGAQAGTGVADQALVLRGWILLPDKVRDCGPLGGIYTALTECRADWALIASCDIPAVRSSLFSQLLEKRSNQLDLVYPVTPDGRKHMTCALYRNTLLPVLTHQLQIRDYRLRLLPDLCRAEAVEIEDPEYVKMLVNFNTPEDLTSGTPERR